MTSRAAGRTNPLLLLAILVVVGTFFLGALMYEYSERQKSGKDDVAERLQLIEERLAQVEGVVNRSSRAVDAKVEELNALLASAEKPISQKEQEVEQRVLGTTQRLARQLEQQKDRQETTLSRVDGKIQELRQASNKAQSDVGALSGRVDSVQAEIDETREELEKTIKELRSVKGDLGFQSGLIATSRKELDALRRLGERNYFEFDIHKSKQREQVGPITIRLRKADPKNNKYKIDVWADDRRIEKKDKTLLEPVQFYMLGSRVPWEVVVNQIEKNRIVGYLATPKLLEDRRTISDGSE